MGLLWWGIYVLCLCAHLKACHCNYRLVCYQEITGTKGLETMTKTAHLGVYSTHQYQKLHSSPSGGIVNNKWE